MNLKKTIPFLVIILTCFSFLFSQDSLKIEKEKFAHEIYNVPPHPKATFKVLENGFRYVLLPNKTPEKRVMVYLYVDSGSLNETDKQQGIAHFLEHMAFNGSKNFPAGTLIEFFKKMGMNFGGDTNAHTSFDETVYKLNLPEEKYREDAIKIISDYAMNILLSPEEIEKERGIILGELRARDNIDHRIRDQNLKFTFPNSLIYNRQPIGIKEVIQNAKQDEFLDYYLTWYRPEAMALVVVGDITTSDWEKNIEDSFNSFKAKAPKRPKAVLTDPGHKGVKINYYFEKEGYETTVEISTAYLKKNADLTIKEIKKMELTEHAATSILNQRLKDKLSQKDNPYTSGRFRVSDWMNQIKSGTIEVNCKPENWKLSLMLIENELRKALQYGVTKQELELFKKDYLNRLDKEVSSMSTVNSNTYMSKILNSISDKNPFQDAVQIKELMKPILDELTKDDILKEFKKYWDVDHRLIAVNGNAEIKDGENEVKKTYEEACKIEISEQKEEALIPFPFEPKPEKSGTIVSKDEIKDLGFTRIVYSNNLVFNFKKTEFKKNEINFNLNLGEGALSSPQGKESLSHVSAIAIMDGGLTKLSKKELLKSLTGKNVSAQFYVDANNFLIQSNTTPEDFELNLQLCRATLLFPGFREESYEAIKKNIDQKYNYINSEISAYFRNMITKKMTKNNPFLSLPERKTLEAITLAEIKEWLMTQFKNCSIEINIVGDFDEKKTIELVSLYFGSLPERQKIIPVKMQSINLKERFEEVEDYKTSVKKALIFQAIPTTDYRDSKEILKLNLLGQILSDKTRKLVREKLAMSYSPGAGHYNNKDFKDYCYFQFTADVDPKNIGAVKDAFDSIITDAAKEGLTQEDLDGNRRPILNSIKTNVQTNGYWLNRILSGSYADPQNSKFIYSMAEGYEAVTLDQINETAKKYLKLENRSVYILQANEATK